MIGVSLLLLAAPRAEAVGIGAVARAFRDIEAGLRAPDCTSLTHAVPAMRLRWPGPRGKADVVQSLRIGGAMLRSSAGDCPKRRIRAGVEMLIEENWETSDAATVAMLQASGYPAEAASWEALTARSRQSTAEDGVSCRCMGAPAEGTPIVYGYPSRRMVRAANRGRIVLGGCIVPADRSRVSCPTGCVPADE